MTAGHSRHDDSRRRILIVAFLAVLVLVAGGTGWILSGEGDTTGVTVEEKLAALRAERAALQARADGEARIALLPAFRAASLLLDALAARVQAGDRQPFDDLPAFRLRSFDELARLNLALGDALERPGEGARRAAMAAAARAVAGVERLAPERSPLVLSYSPRFVPPRRGASEITLEADAHGAAPTERTLPLVPPVLPAEERRSAAPVPRYAPEFAAGSEPDAPVPVEIVGSYLTRGEAAVLSIGAWRGRATVGIERLRFVVPRTAFATDGRRTSFAVGTLSLRGGGRAATFQLLFTVLPDRPGSFALDQRVRTAVQETNTLVSPEILARAPEGETRTVRRCFDPPPGWRFDRERLRVVVVERLGWQDDNGDPGLNTGAVDFVPAETPGQVCIAVVARPASPRARTATIGRFEATLVRDLPSDKAVKSGVRALDWREPVRVAMEPGMIEWKLYVRLFDDVDREFSGAATTALPAEVTPFLRISRKEGGNVVVLTADPAARP
ncbi:hypothetical protein [Reyranella sp.]|uniref:hypothetical protein n=1 Tax=Reyranella sp. TaxID=1929291 RepID=UPI003BA8CF59